MRAATRRAAGGHLAGVLCVIAVMAALLAPVPSEAAGPPRPDPAEGVVRPPDGLGPGHGAASVDRPGARDRAADRRDTTGGEASTVPGSLIVTSADEPAGDRLTRAAGGLLRARGVAASTARIGGGYTRVRVPPGRETTAAALLARQPGVLAVEPEHVYRFLDMPDDPLVGEQWAHHDAGGVDAWAHATGSPSVKAAVLDSGVDGTHLDLSDNVVAQVRTADGTVPGVSGAGTPHDNAACPPGTTGHGHGTEVAGVLGALGDNGVGVAGVAWRVGIVDVAVTGPDLGGSGTIEQKCQGTTDTAVLAGLQFVRTHHPDVAVVNMSFGFAITRCPSAIQHAIDELRASGVTVVAASGNHGDHRRVMPAGCDGVIAVGADDRGGRLADYSGRQHYLDLTAPGGRTSGILTTSLDAGGAATYALVAGTSFASPYVAGVVALVQDHRDRTGRPRLSPDRVEALLEITARPPPGGGHDPRYGWGRLQAGAALDHLARGAPIAAPRTHPRIRWGRSDGRTEPITQAIAVSQGMFEHGEARHVLVARSDDYADALAGSGLGAGHGPILFTPPDRGLDPRVRNEITRVLPAGGRVYLLGGEAALDGAVEDDLASAGYDDDVVRLWGPSREWTATAIAEEVGRRLSDLGGPRTSAAILARRDDWPDAVAAGSLAAAYGIPVLLTSVDALHPETARWLGADRPRSLYVVGGTAAVAQPTMDAAAGVARPEYLERLGGPARDATAVAVARELEWQLSLSDDGPAYGIVVHLDRADAYAHTLAATSAAARTRSVFVPVRAGAAGTWVTPDAEAYACGLSVDVVLPGATDLLPAALAETLQDLYDRSPPSCTATP